MLQGLLRLVKVTVGPAQLATDLEFNQGLVLELVPQAFGYDIEDIAKV